MNKLVLYDDTDQKILFSENKIGEGAYGIVYKQDDNTCIKRIKCKYDKYDLECLKLIKELNLK